MSETPQFLAERLLHRHNQVHQREIRHSLKQSLFPKD